MAGIVEVVSVTVENRLPCVGMVERKTSLGFEYGFLGSVDIVGGCVLFASSALSSLLMFCSSIMFM